MNHYFVEIKTTKKKSKYLAMAENEILAISLAIQEHSETGEYDIKYIKIKEV